MNRIVLWGLNEQSRNLVDENKISIIIDKFSEKSRYKNVNISKDVNILNNQKYSLCVVSSSTYFFDIKKEIRSVNKDIEIVHINTFLEKYPKMFFLESLEEIKKCKMINSSIEGKIFINNGLTIQVQHDIPISINVDKNAELYLDNNMLMDGVEISARGNSKIFLGNKTYINKLGIIRSKNLIRIGNNCAIAWNVTIMDNDGYTFSKNNDKKVVEISSNVWIGNNVNILKDTKIGKKCIIASMSKVKGKFNKKCLIAGNPAIKVKENVNWK